MRQPDYPENDATRAGDLLLEPSRTPDLPDRRLDYELELVQRVDLPPEVTPEFLILRPTVTEAPPAPQGPISVIIDELGNFVVQDTLGAAHGVGASPHEAIADFYSTLDARLAFLRANELRLHPKLLRELAALKTLFPDR